MLPLLLVNAPYPRVLKFHGQPTSLLYAASKIVPLLEKEHGCGSARLINYNLFSPEFFNTSGEGHFGKLISALQPRVVAISVTTAALESARRLAAVTKAVSNALVITGGPHEDDVTEPTAVWDPCVDISVAGDGECALKFIVETAMAHPASDPEELTRKLHAVPLPDDLEGLGHVIFRGIGAGSSRPDAWRTMRLFNPQRPSLDLDRLPLLPRHLLEPEEKYHYSIFQDSAGHVKATAQVMTQRGCVAKCDFCSESQRLFQRSVGSVIAELGQLKADGYEAIFFDDSTFTNLSAGRKDFLRSLVPWLRRYGFECGCQTRVDMVDEETLRMLADAGFTYVYFGIESMEPQLLSALGKHYTVDTICKALRICRDVGLRVGGSLLLGAPGRDHRTLETVETAVSTFRQIRQFVDEGPITLISINAFQYYPGTTSTVSLSKSEPAASDYRTPKEFVFPNEFPFTLLEENPALCPHGLREIMGEILEQAVTILGDVLIDETRLTAPEKTK